MSLKVVNLSKRYKDTWALRDLSFDAMSGEIFGIFGPLGSGKTSLLNSIAGVAKINGGSVRVDEVDITGLAKPDRGIRTSTVSAASVWDAIFRNGSATDNAERHKRHLDDAIVGSGRVLLLDEPFRNMDIDSIKARVERIRAARRERGVTVIFASNDLEQVLSLCDRVAVLVRGEIKQIGTPQEIYEKPESRIVAAVTGRNNLFAARRLSSSKADIPEFLSIDGSHRLFAQRIERKGLGALNQNVTLGIRPEHISISFGASFPADNLLKATVTGVRFLGPTTLIELDADGLKIEALVLRLVGLNTGDECMVGLPPDRIQIFRD